MSKEIAVKLRSIFQNEDSQQHSYGWLLSFSKHAECNQD